MGHPGGQLTDGLHLLRLAQLRLQAQLLGDVLDITMDHLAGDYRMEGPGKGSPLVAGLQVQLALTCFQAVADDLLGVGRQDRAWTFLAEGAGKDQRGLIEIGHSAVGVQLQRRVGVELGERGHLL